MGQRWAYGRAYETKRRKPSVVPSLMKRGDKKSRYTPFRNVFAAEVGQTGWGNRTAQDRY